MTRVRGRSYVRVVYNYFRDYDPRTGRYTSSVTIKKMQQMAEGMGCRFVYFIVPDKPVHDILNDRARKKALTIVGQASNHMALEAQTLSEEQLRFEVACLQQELLKEMSSDFWDD